MDAATVTALRERGWSIEQIVIETRSPPAEVAVALGADPRAVESWTLPTLVRAVAWTQWRRDGATTTQIAARAGVSHQRVSTLTIPFGPFQRPADPVHEWVAARRTGQTLAEIAQRHRVNSERVSRATAPHRPFPYPNRQPPHHVSTRGMARLLGVAEPTVRRWQNRADFPPPLDGTRPPLWDTASVTSWASQHLNTCPACGAQAQDLARHRRRQSRPTTLKPPTPGPQHVAPTAGTGTPPAKSGVQVAGPQVPIHGRRCQPGRGTPHHDHQPATTPQLLRR